MGKEPRSSTLCASLLHGVVPHCIRFGLQGEDELPTWHCFPVHRRKLRLLATKPRLLPQCIPSQPLRSSEHRALCRCQLDGRRVGSSLDHLRASPRVVHPDLMVKRRGAMLCGTMYVDHWCVRALQTAHAIHHFKTLAAAFDKLLAQLLNLEQSRTAAKSSTINATAH